jgi:hypothetical protein
MQTENTAANLNGPVGDTPAWLQVTDENAIITLSTPAVLNGIKLDRITLRSPSVSEVRACQKQAGNDDELLDDILFASLAEVGLKDIQGLKVKDYKRVQAGYFRLVGED